MVRVRISAVSEAAASAAASVIRATLRSRAFINRYCSYHGARMRKIFLALALAVAALAQPVPVVFDTDMGNDVDDALALAVLHALESRGECRLIAVKITKANPWAEIGRASCRKECR